MEVDNSAEADEYPDPPEGTVKTTVSEKGEVIDHVLFDKQPGFVNDPSLKMDEGAAKTISCMMYESGKEAPPSACSVWWVEKAPPYTIPIVRFSKKQREAQRSRLSKGSPGFNYDPTHPSPSFTPKPPTQSPTSTTR